MTVHAQSKPARPRQSGFTLVETMMAIVIVGILVAIAVPGFTRMNLTTKRSSVVNDLVAGLQYARGEAIKRGMRVVLCPGTTQCGTDWTVGWLVFVNTNADTPPTVDAGEPILKTGGAVPSQITVTATQNSFVYRPYNTRMAAGNITVCTPLGPAQARTIIVSPTGRARTSDKKSDGISALTCP